MSATEIFELIGSPSRATVLAPVAAFIRESTAIVSLFAANRFGDGKGTTSFAETIRREEGILASRAAFPALYTVGQGSEAAVAIPVAVKEEQDAAFWVWL
jgi:hypothetical protein